MSVKEHQRRMQIRAEDTRNGKWRESAACDPRSGVAKASGVDIPPGFASESLEEQRDAALFCHTICPNWVREACLDLALETGDDNYVLGGTTETERRHLLKKRRKSA